MNKVTFLENKFKNKFIYRGNTNYLSKKDSIDFLKELNNLDVKLLGIDGFNVIGKGIQPEQDFSINFSDEYNLDLIYNKSLSLINSCPDETIFEFVY